MCLSLQTVLYCLQVEELQAQVVILWFGDSVGTKTLQGGFEVQVFSQGAFIVASNGASVLRSSTSGLCSFWHFPKEKTHTHTHKKVSSVL